MQGSYDWLPLRLAEIRRGLSAASNRLEQIQNQLDDGENAEAMQSVYRLATITEKLALRVRSLPELMEIPPAEHRMDEIISTSMQIEVGKTPEGWLHVRFPRLLPKKERMGTEFIRRGLNYALHKYFQEHEASVLHDAVLIIRHNYDKASPKKRMRDHDNVEVNAVVDAVAFFALRDDSPSVCSHYYCSRPDNADGTEVFVVPSPDFPTWYLHANIAAEQGRHPAEHKPEQPDFQM